MGLGPNPGPTPAWRCLREGDLKETQGSGRVGMGRTEGKDAEVPKEKLSEEGWGKEERKKREREQLGTSWGGQMEQVRRWNNGRVRMEGQCLERWT